MKPLILKYLKLLDIKPSQIKEVYLAKYNNELYNVYIICKWDKGDFLLIGQLTKKRADECNAIIKQLIIDYNKNKSNYEKDYYYNNKDKIKKQQKAIREKKRNQKKEMDEND